MEFLKEYLQTDYLFLLGLVVVIVVMLRQTLLRIRKNAEKKRQHHEAIQRAKEAERKQQMQTTMQKLEVSSPATRMPKRDPFASSFTGNIQGVAAKWEAEIHKLGRQIIGQIDSKMAALQTITLDANRTANRLEILVEHLEQVARQQIECQQSQIAKSQMPQNAEAESGTESGEVEPDANVIPAVIPAVQSVSDAAPLGIMLKELSEDIEGIHKTIKKSTAFIETVEPAVVLRLAELQANLKASDSAEIRGEVEMLSNYGIDAEEIARRLDISLGEVDLILQVQRSRTGEI